MKYLITVWLVSAMLVGSAYADNTQTTTQQGNIQTQQTTVVKGPGYSEATAQGGEAAAGAYSGIYWDWNYNPTSIVRYPEYRVPPVSPGQAQLPWPYPPQFFLWNGIRDNKALIVYHNHIWTLKEVDDALNRVKPNGVLEGLGCMFFSLLPKGPEDVVEELKLKGFDWELGLNDYKLRPKYKFPKIQTIVDVNFLELFKEYTWIGAMGVTGCERRLTDQVIRCAMRVALIYDLDLGLITPGINPVNSATGISSGVGYTTAGVTNNLSLIGSISGGRAYVEGRPGVGVIFFRKNGHSASPSPSPLALPAVPAPTLPNKDEELLKKGEVNGGIRGAELNQMRDIWRRGAGN